ncbi:MAG: ATP-binding protein [Desulforudis sp.]|jgi:hypothetical protein|nr:MAG: ATP-binding protein [Desulforudis sp.]
MDYSRFVELINGGEKRNVDFKIKCDAFQQSLSSNAELAKDICAMSNNGNIVSYIILGVSNDRKNFLSVANPNLKDDDLQVFCKTRIFPPPKVKLIRKSWSKAHTNHKNKEFVIIQIGPHRRQAFRLAQDFINYAEEICYRRNEVWIRRGATSDLATPEEIERLIKGEAIENTPDDILKQEERLNFSKLAVANRLCDINAATNDELRRLGFKKAKEKQERRRRLSLQEELLNAIYPRSKKLDWYLKRYPSYVMAVYMNNSKESLSQKEIEQFEIRILAWLHFARKSDFPPLLSKIINQDVLPIRRLLLQPVLANVPRKRIQTALKTWKWAGYCSHYFTPVSNTGYSSDTFFPSSSELLIVDDIESVSDYKEELLKALQLVTENENTICSPITG